MSERDGQNYAFPDLTHCSSLIARLAQSAAANVFGSCAISARAALATRAA